MNLPRQAIPPAATDFVSPFIPARKPISKRRRSASRILRDHSLSLVSLAILIVWIVLYCVSNPQTRVGAFFGNAIADWTGVVVTVIATKYFYERGSTESREPAPDAGSLARHVIHQHSLTIFLVLTGLGWLLLDLRASPDSKWGQVVGNILSEWTQILGLVLMTKRLIEKNSKESRR